MKTGFKDPETPWLSQFYTNESNGTKFSTCFYIGMGLRDFFVRTSLGENGYFIGFWDFLPYFKLTLHTSKWILCPQKVWKLFIYGPKAVGREKVLCVSLNSPHSERPPGQTAGPSNLPFWILGIHYRANSHKKFHLPGTIFKGLKFKGKI